MNQQRISVLSMLSVLCAVSCQGLDKSEGTPGERGLVEFAYHGGCLFGCPIEQPLLSGSHQQIQVSDPGDGPGVEVRSSDEDVARFSVERSCFCERDDSTRRLDIATDASCESPWHKHCDNDVAVEAGKPGEAWLDLRDATGERLDRVQVLVRDAERCDFRVMLDDQFGAIHTTHVETAAGKSFELTAMLFDDKGRSLLAADGVQWHSSDAEIAELSAWLAGSGADVSTGLSVTVRVQAAGSAEIGLRVPGLDTAEAHVSLDAQP